jgi:hypothetical protein
MKQWRVYGTVPVGVTVTVDARDAEEARAKAYEEWPGLRSYCAGIRERGSFVGSREEHLDVTPCDDPPEFRDVEEVV